MRVGRDKPTTLKLLYFLDIHETLNHQRKPEEKFTFESSRRHSTRLLKEEGRQTKSRVSSDPASFLYNYQRETIIETVDANFNTSVNDVGLKKITVNVYWQSPVLSKEKTIQLQYVVSNY